MLWELTYVRKDLGSSECEYISLRTRFNANGKTQMS